MSNHRWSWPEEPRRLTEEWFTSKEVRTFGGPNATKGARHGRIISLLVEVDGEHQTIESLVERRPTLANESGRYVYRFIDAASARTYYRKLLALNQERWKIDAPEVSLTITPGLGAGLIPPVLLVETPFEKGLHEWVKELGGGWNKLNQCWLFGDERDFDEVVKAFRHRYGLEDERRRYTVVLGFEALVPELLKYTTVRAFGREVAIRGNRWQFLRAGSQVWFEGAPLDPMTVHIWGVPARLYEAELERWGKYIRGVQVSQDGEDLSGKNLLLKGKPLKLLKTISNEVWSTLDEESQVPSAGEPLHDWLISLLEV